MQTSASCLFYNFIFWNFFDIFSMGGLNPPPLATPLIAIPRQSGVTACISKSQTREQSQHATVDYKTETSRNQESSGAWKRSRSSWFLASVRYDTIRYDTVDLRALKSWRDGQLNLAHGPKTKNNEKTKIKDRVAQKKRCRQKSVEAVRECFEFPSVSHTVAYQDEYMACK